jgi:hypothetical protein
VGSSVQGHDGRGPGWGFVILKLALLAGFTVLLAEEYWETNRGSAYFVIAVSAAAWAWILASLRRTSSEPDQDDE